MSVVEYEVDGRVARITLNRPHRGNGINRHLVTELERCVEWADLDPAVHVLLLSGGLDSATVLAIVAVVVERAGSIWTKALVVLGPLALITFLTVGSVVSSVARAVLHALSIDPTFTGRTEIWKFTFEAISEHPWKGHGFEAFWYSESLRYGVEDSSRWMAAVATSHNSYIDLALTIGIPGLALVFIAFIIAPLRDFHRTLPTAENAADLPCAPPPAIT